VPEAHPSRANVCFEPAQRKLPWSSRSGKLGFVDIEQKAAGLVPVYTDLKNPDFGEVAKAMGLWGRSVAKAGELEESIQSWLAQPGPALLHVKVKPMQLVMPPSPFVSPQGNAAGQRSRCLGDDGGEYSLTTSSQGAAFIDQFQPNPASAPAIQPAPASPHSAW
jgi:hypothetical protein